MGRGMRPKRIVLAGAVAVAVIAGIIVLRLALTPTSHGHRRHKTRIMWSVPRTATVDTASAASPAVDDRIARFARLVGTTKQHVVETLGPPKEYVYGSGPYTYTAGEFQAFLQFFDPERDHSNFGSKTRGGAATVVGLSLRFNAAWSSLSMPVVLHSVDASASPSYLLIDQNAIRYQLLSHLSRDGFTVGIGGVQKAGFGYEVLARCTEPPLTGKEAFDYATNRMEMGVLTANPNFRWTRCAPVGVRMSTASDWKGYELRFYDDSLGAHGLLERVAINGAEGS